MIRYRAALDAQQCFCPQVYDLMLISFSDCDVDPIMGFFAPRPIWSDVVYKLLVGHAHLLRKHFHNVCDFLWWWWSFSRPFHPYLSHRFLFFQVLPCSFLDNLCKPYLLSRLPISLVHLTYKVTVNGQQWLRLLLLRYSAVWLMFSSFERSIPVIAAMASKSSFTWDLLYVSFCSFSFGAICFRKSNSASCLALGVIFYRRQARVHTLFSSISTWAGSRSDALMTKWQGWLKLMSELDIMPIVEIQDSGVSKLIVRVMTPKSSCEAVSGKADGTTIWRIWLKHSSGWKYAHSTVDTHSIVEISQYRYFLERKWWYNHRAELGNLASKGISDGFM